MHWNAAKLLATLFLQAAANLTPVIAHYSAALQECAYDRAAFRQPIECCQGPGDAIREEPRIWMREACFGSDHRNRRQEQ